MMPNTRILNRILDFSRNSIHLVDGRRKHFTFIIKKNKVISWGYNDIDGQHRVAKILGYPSNTVHSELSAIIRYQGDIKLLSDCTLINIRLNRFKNTRMSKPCSKCAKLIRSLNIRSVWFTGVDGEFCEYVDFDVGDILDQRILTLANLV